MKTQVIVLFAFLFLVIPTKVYAIGGVTSDEKAEKSNLEDVIDLDEQDLSVNSSVETVNDVDVKTQSPDLLKKLISGLLSIDIDFLSALELLFDGGKKYSIERIDIKIVILSEVENDSDSDPTQQENVEIFDVEITINIADVDLENLIRIRRAIVRNETLF